MNNAVTAAAVIATLETLSAAGLLPGVTMHTFEWGAVVEIECPYSRVAGGQLYLRADLVNGREAAVAVNHSQGGVIFETTPAAVLRAAVDTSAAWAAKLA